MSEETGKAPRLDLSRSDGLKEMIKAFPELPIIFDISGVGYEDVCYPKSCEVVWMLNTQTPYDKDAVFLSEDEFYDTVLDHLRWHYENEMYTPTPNESRLEDEAGWIAERFHDDWVQVILVKLTNE